MSQVIRMIDELDERREPPRPMPSPVQPTDVEAVARLLLRHPAGRHRQTVADIVAFAAAARAHYRSTGQALLWGRGDTGWACRGSLMEAAYSYSSAMGGESELPGRPTDGDPAWLRLLGETYLMVADLLEP